MRKIIKLKNIDPFKYQANKVLIDGQPGRQVIFNGVPLGVIVCRGTQRNGYEVLDRPDLPIGHNQKACAILLILEHMIKTYQNTSKKEETK